MGHRGTETDFELTTIERLERLGYTHLHGEEITRLHEEVVLKDHLRAYLVSAYKELPAASIDDAVTRFSRPDGVDTLRRNMAFHAATTRGLEIRVEREDGQAEFAHVYPINWDEPGENDFLIVNQFPIHGQNDRRPDLIIFVNGLPLVVFELKNPYAIRPSVDDALNQIGHYQNEIPQLFDYNAVTVVSDGITTLHGMWSADAEWYAPWKSIDGATVEKNTTGSMKTLAEGLFAKDRLLAYIRDFILFEVLQDKITKKGAKYHQFFAVRLAAEKSIAAVTSESEKRIGVIWHTTGSGKSLSMVFLVGILRRQPALDNPTFVIEVDRTDLDSQLSDQFNVARALVGDVTQASDVDHLRDLLRTEGGEVILTTIEKFRLKEGEIEHPELSARSNIILIADEAHRSQYGFDQGYARCLREAIPNARRLGFTGTPVTLSGADTIEVFGDLIHTYDIKQSQDDKATVPIFYEPRQVRLHLNQKDVDEAVDEVAGTYNIADFERRKPKWAALAKAARAENRVKDMATDLLGHFRSRTATLKGKAMIVCMTRENCVELYNGLTALPDCPEVKIVMTGNLGEDPTEWSAAGHLTTKVQRQGIKKRMVDPDDPLQIVIVCDMWLTGTDIPCLHTLYIDKPMKGHNMVQAISRVNRVFRDKPHGLIVDYIGIGDDLREATNKYTKGGGEGKPAPNIEVEAKPLFFVRVDETRAAMPLGIDYGDWRKLSKIDLEDRYALVYGHLTDTDQLRDEFLQVEHKLTMTFTLVKHLDDIRPFANEVIFYQRIRNQLLKTLPGQKPGRSVEEAIKDIVDDAVDSEGVVDIFQSAGIERADISILDDHFLQTFKDKPNENLRLKLLEKLLADEIQLRQKKNLAKAKSFRALLEETLRRYHNRLIDAAAVIRAMVEMRQEWQEEDKRAAALGLSEEELAFYDSVSTNYQQIYGQEFLSGLVHDVVQTIKRNLKVEWTEPHRDNVKAAVRSAVRRVLRRREVKAEDFDQFLNFIMAQAEALYSDWPLAA